MIRKIVFILTSLSTVAYTMEPNDEAVLPFYTTYHKKRSVEEALDSGLPTKKQHITPLALAQFEAAIDQENITAARQILVDNQYQPKQLNLNEAIRLDDLPDMIYWLGAQRNADPEDDPFNTALHTATAYGNDFFIKLLLHAGIDVNAPNPGDWTPLHFAVWHGRTNAMVLLLDNGADTNARIVNNHTPLYNITRYYNLDYHGVPNEWVKDLVMKYVTHAQFNQQKNAEDRKQGNDRIRALLMALRRNNIELPRNIRHKIVSYLPEDINSLPLFRLLFYHVEQDSNALAALVEHCPFAWLRAICSAKNSTQERQALVAHLAPIIAAYRTSKLRELLPALEIAQHMYPGAQGPKSVVKRCIKQVKNEHLILKTIIDTLDK